MAGVVAAIWVWGYVFECEYPFWPTMWLAQQTKTPDGSRVTDLIRLRTGASYVAQHWHHCSWCDVMYPHAQHTAIKVFITSTEGEYLRFFDWDIMHRRLLPMSVLTAKLLPELVPSGGILEAAGDESPPQHDADDALCRVVCE